MARNATPHLVGLSHAGNRPHVDCLNDVHAHILASIVDQRLPPGTKLNELMLCEIFNVGRRHIAQVLTRLAHDGLVVQHANRGAFVAAPDADEARDIFEARRLIECDIARIVACRIGAGEADATLLTPLRDNIAEESAHLHYGRLREAIRVSCEFHILLGEISGNAILANMVRQLVARCSLVVSLYENRNTIACWQDDHGAFVDRLAAGRADEAVERMRHHLGDVEASLDFSRRAGDTIDLRRVYAPNG